MAGTGWANSPSDLRRLLHSGPFDPSKRPLRSNRYDYCMWIGWIEFDILLGDVQSLKEKRSVIRPLLAELKRRFDVSVAEVGDHDQYRRSQVGAGLVAADRAHLVEVLTAVERFVAGLPEFELLSARQRELHSED